MNADNMFNIPRYNSKSVYPVYPVRFKQRFYKHSKNYEPSEN